MPGDLTRLLLPSARGPTARVVAHRWFHRLRARCRRPDVHLGAPSRPPVSHQCRALRRSPAGHRRALRHRAPSHLHLATDHAGEHPVSVYALAVGGACPGALCRRHGDSRVHRGPPAGIALRRALRRLPQARSGLPPVCEIVSCMIRVTPPNRAGLPRRRRDGALLRASAVSLVFLLAAGAALAADLTEQYRATADRLIASALADTEGYNRLAYLCYRIGHRLSGSPGLEKAVAWSVETMKAAGLTNVRVIPTKVPHWVRGAESARMLTPLDRPLHMLGLGMSIGTPPGGITAPVVAVATFEDLAKLGRASIQGKIVLYNEEYRGYGATRLYRSTGAARPAEFGAVAALVRSATPLAMQIPHTGEMSYDENQPKIPAAALSPEDAMMMARLVDDGVPVTVHLEMGAQMLPDADSGDVIGEIPGREHPEEVVVMGGHLDSWDVGQGAQDDGASVVACLEAVALMKKLGLDPRRTIRVAFWVNEENGGRGGEAYREFVGDQIKKQAAAIEMDGGAEAPPGVGAGGG